MQTIHETVDGGEDALRRAPRRMFEEDISALNQIR